MAKKIELGLNTIFFGPPGTGKTYNTVIAAVNIIDGDPVNDLAKKPYSQVLKRYKDLKDNGLIISTTFHQSYGYEEFIEGIRPKTDDNGNISYHVKSGIFKNFCESEAYDKGNPLIKELENKLASNTHVNIWKVVAKSIKGNYIDGIEKDNRQEGLLNTLDNKAKEGDVILVGKGDSHIQAIGVLKFETNENKPRYKIEYILKNIYMDIVTINEDTHINETCFMYEMKKMDLKKVLDLIKKGYNKVFIIDEINRGNITKIFGELITLVEDSKRLGEPEGMTVKLPYSGESGKEFGIPNNVYIIGTMNTADRSIALMDTALRRRFSFVEMMPKPALLNEVKVNNISIGQLLRDMNEKITVLYDREHTIGHAYFMPLVKELKEKERFKLLGEIFKNKIIPLLQEYFYDDYAKIRLVLGDDKAGNTPQFIKKNSSKAEILFGKTNVEKFGLEGTIVYSINDDAFKSKEAYNHILNTPVKISKEDKETPNPNDGAPNATIEDNEKQDKLASPKPSEGTKS